MLPWREQALARQLGPPWAGPPASPVPSLRPVASRFVRLAALSFCPRSRPHPRPLPTEQGPRSGLSAQGSPRDLALLPWRSSVFLQGSPTAWDALHHYEGYSDQWGCSYDVAPVQGLPTEVCLWNDCHSPRFRTLISPSSIHQMLERLTSLETDDLSFHLTEKRPHVRCRGSVRRDDHVLKPPE